MSAGETTIVLSDLHSHGRALRRAIEIARSQRVDRWVVLGDLLTYGCDIDEVLDLVDELCATSGAVVVRGNHDQLYFDLGAGESAYYARLPDWIRESVDYTLERLDVPRFLRRFAWRDELAVGEVLFSHASPFGAGDWRYLNTEHELEVAAEHLHGRGFRIGVFGHVHRHRAFTLDVSGERGYATTTVTIPPTSRAAITAGSLGQPRDRSRGSSMLRLDVDRASFRAELIDIDYDVGAHVAALQRTSMSDATKRKLCEYFVTA